MIRSNCLSAQAPCRDHARLGSLARRRHSRGSASHGRRSIAGYAPFLKHGIIGRGLIPYDRIFADAGRDRIRRLDLDRGWAGPAVGMEHLRESALFLRSKVEQDGLA